MYYNLFVIYVCGGRSPRGPSRACVFYQDIVRINVLRFWSPFSSALSCHVLFLMLLIGCRGKYCHERHTFCREIYTLFGFGSVALRRV